MPKHSLKRSLPASSTASASTSSLTLSSSSTTKTATSTSTTPKIQRIHTASGSDSSDNNDDVNTASDIGRVGGGRSKKSDVWLHFTLVPGSAHVKCNHCAATLKYSGGSTSGMRHHINKLHAEVIVTLSQASKAAPKKTGPIDRYLTKNMKMPTDLPKERVKELEEVACDYIFSSGLPFNSFESNNMKKFLETAVPGWDGVGRNVVARNLHIFYKARKDEIMKKLEKVSTPIIFSVYIVGLDPPCTYHSLNQCLIHRVGKITCRPTFEWLSPYRWAA